MIALVTLAVGNEYLERYKKTCMESQEAYAERCGYDFLVLTYLPEAEFMKQDYPKNQGTISFHKILVCSQEWSEKYDMIIFIDADILIHKNAPSIHNYIEYGDKIGIIDEFSQPTLERRISLQKSMGWETSAKEYHSLCEFNLETKHVLNTGVLVLQPKKHRKLLESIFEKYIYTCNIHPRGFIYEQTAIGYELQKNDCYILLPNKFNTLWAIHKWENSNINLKEFYDTTWFLHFAGNVDLEKAATLYYT